MVELRGDKVEEVPIHRMYFVLKCLGLKVLERSDYSSLLKGIKKRLILFRKCMGRINKKNLCVNSLHPF